MNKQFPQWLAFTCVALVLIACQPIQPVTISDSSASASASASATYMDEHGFFTVQYPADRVVEPYLFGDDLPVPHVAISSDTEINEKSMAWEPLPEDQIGVGIMLLPRACLPRRD